MIWRFRRKAVPLRQLGGLQARWTIPPSAKSNMSWYADLKQSAPWWLMLLIQILQALASWLSSNPS